MQVLFNDAGSLILSQLVWEEYSSPAAFELNYRANSLSTQTDFDRLVALEALPDITLYEHQQETVLKVLRELRGRAVLADEVGLGKTIEAGIIIKEYLLRALARKVLVLVPASLVSQWYEELAVNLRIPIQIQDGSISWGENLILASIDYAKRPQHRGRVLSYHYDLVVIDEAHKLKNSATQNWRFANELHKKFLLLLTATPVQNDLQELYNLITLLKPGQLKTFREFKREFVTGKRTPRNLEKLRGLLKEVMVRTNRRETMLRLPKRIVQSTRVEWTECEEQFYHAAMDVLQRIYRRKNEAQRNVLPLIVIAREICSSPAAALASLHKIRHRDKNLSAAEVVGLDRAIKLGQQVEVTAKAAKLVDLVSNAEDKVLVFTEFRETQQFLASLLGQQGIVSVLFHGSLSLGQKDQAVADFRRDIPVMISTESGGEGRNLQFCHLLVNYDLPWNPMRIEQRIGRVHRLGQNQDVLITNLITEKTIEEYVHYLLEEKLRLFSDVMGEVETIINSAGLSLEKQLANILLGSPEQTISSLSVLGDRVGGLFHSYQAIQALTDDLLGVGG